MNRYPAWVNMLVLGVVLAGALFALPNVFGVEPAVQVSRQGEDPLSEGFIPRIQQILDGAGIDYGRAYVADGSVMVNFADTESQFEAKTVLRDTLDADVYGVAQTLASRTPGWLRGVGLEPMSLGLDLRGGIHFLYEVNLDEVVNRVLANTERDVKRLLRQNDIRYERVRYDGSAVRIALADADDRDEARRLISRDNPELDLQNATVAGQPGLVARLTDTELQRRQDFAIEQNTTTLRNRVNALGVAEPLVQRQGLDRIVVQLPGVQDATAARRILGATATLEFRLADVNGDPFEAERTGRAPTGTRLYKRDDGTPILLERDVIVTGDNITDAAPNFSQGQPVVSVRLDAQGAKDMLRTTQEHLNEPMAVVFIEQERQLAERNGEQVEEIVTRERVISVATIRGVFSNQFQIEGLTSQEANELALLLRAGSLAAPIFEVEERTVGPSLGQENIERGLRAVVIGFLLVVVFMVFYYRVFGLFANLALLVNLVMIVGMLSLLQASLTLPGIAGIVLTVGMAVDANVLIFERIREELRNGNSVQASIQAGYDKAFSSIADANVTTFIAAAVLWLLGTGPIKGFAVTLSLGILTSMFTAIVGTRALVNLVYGGRRVQRLAI